jgi:hypothetical protein
MFDGMAGAILSPDGDDVEPAIHIPQAVPEEITFGHLPDLLLFCGRDRFLGAAEGYARPHLDFDKHERLPVEGDDIDLAAEETEAGFDDGVSFAAKEFEGDRFSGLPDVLCGSFDAEQTPPVLDLVGQVRSTSVSQAGQLLVGGSRFQRTPSFVSSRRMPRARSSFRISSASLKFFSALAFCRESIFF